MKYCYIRTSEVAPAPKAWLKLLVQRMTYSSIKGSFSRIQTRNRNTADNHPSFSQPCSDVGVVQCPKWQDVIEGGAKCGGYSAGHRPPWRPGVLNDLLLCYPQGRLYFPIYRTAVTLVLLTPPSSPGNLAIMATWAYPTLPPDQLEREADRALVWRYS